MGSEKKGEVKLFGTHHFLEKEVIEKEINEFNPEIILIELCNGRVSLIENPELKKPNYSLLGLISRAIKKKADKEGKQYGSDMISAYKIAKERNIPIGLIDRPLVETQVFFKDITLREKLKLLNELRKFSSKKIGVSEIVDEVNNTNTDEILFKLKLKCPNLFYYLVTSRDEYMINKIKSYLYDYPDKRILIFVGKGHEEKIKKEILKPIEEVVKGGIKK